MQAAMLADLAERIGQVERPAPTEIGARVEGVRTGLPGPLDRLERGVLHEWLCGGEATDDGLPWTAPLLVYAHLARFALPGAVGSGLVVWVGRRMWPQPHVLSRPATENGRDLLARSLLIDPPALNDRLWAIDLCLRSEAVGVVIADVSSMRMAHSRRLQLAAESGSVLALLARPWCERKEHSAAARRWRVEPARSPTASPRWQVELVRCKGVQRGGGMDAHATLVLEHDHAACCLRAVADVADRPRASAGSPGAEPERIIRRTG